ncbi:MAG: alpha/beta hydrolase family protein [Anaerolineales bacterium]
MRPTLTTCDPRTRPAPPTWVVLLRIPLLIVLGTTATPAASSGLSAGECVVEVVSYSHAGLRLVGLLMRPQGEGPFPVVIHNHGSRAGNEARRSVQPDAGCFPFAQAKRWVVFLPERRGYGGSEGPTWSQEVLSLPLAQRGRAAMIRFRVEAADVVASLEYLRTLPYVDRARIAVTGTSHGGVVTLLAAAAAPQAFVSVVSQAAGSNWDPHTVVQEMAAAGARITVPILLQHGTADTLVPISRSLELYDALKRMGKEVSFLRYPDGHLIFDYPYYHFPLEAGPAWLGDFVTFLEGRFRSR